jgi:signal transduction histidine kinase/ActR/RegA family two-component response regulator
VSEPSAGDRLAVLLVEDSEDDAELVMGELRQGGYNLDVVRVETAAEMAAALREGGRDLVISDYALPTFSAPLAFQVLRDSGVDLPFVMVSGTVGEEVAVELMRIGIHDFVLKGNLRRLTTVIRREMRDAAMRRDQVKIRQQLVISERMASVGTLAAGVAHEINNPLSVVVGNLDYMAADLARVGDLVGRIGRARPDEATGGAGGVEANTPEALALHGIETSLADVAQCLTDAQQAADRVRIIVRDLRLFSRADEEVRGPVDVRRVLDSSLSMARNEIRHRANVRRNYGDVPSVDGNEARLGQVFLNLIVNAAQAMPEGKSTENQIVVTTRAAAGQVLIEISDSGAGIPPDVLPRIFDVFFTTKPIGVGTGLGLSICHRIVTAIGGTIAIDSQVGAGTTVRVALPAASIAAVKTVSDAPSAGQGARRRGAVLIVEDEHSVARMLQKVLSSTDAVTLASSGVEALSHIEAQEAFDVILCDLMMPEMTGMDFYQAVVSKSQATARRIVFMTGGAFTPTARAFLDQVENLRLDKPVDLKLLRQLVHSAVVENDVAR